MNAQNNQYTYISLEMLFLAFYISIIRKWLTMQELINITCIP